IIAYREEHPSADKVTFTPMIAKPIVPVEAKIIGILRHFETNERISLNRLIEDAVSLSDMIAIFLGVLELVKMRRIVLADDEAPAGGVLDIRTEFMVGEVTDENRDLSLSPEFSTGGLLTDALPYTQASPTEGGEKE
ncbi:MAG: hypothetical protein II229_00185, partial [Clostridia bacterium]|nr:hypothetical protein [Clostridia bacterium]